MENRIVKAYGRYKNILYPTDLIAVQMDSFRELIDNGIQEIFRDISPIRSKDGRYSIYFPDGSRIAAKNKLTWRLQPPEYPIEECIEKRMTYCGTVFTDVLMTDNEQGKVWKTGIYLTDLPFMTPQGSFIISGTEKVVLTQLVKSPGIYYFLTRDELTGKSRQHAKIVPDKGTYIEIYANAGRELFVQYDRRITIPFTAFLRIMSYADDRTGTSPFTDYADSEIFEVFEKECGQAAKAYISATIQVEQKLYRETTAENAAKWFFRRNNQKGDLPEICKYIERRFYDLAVYDLQKTGRKKLNERLGLDDIISRTHRTLTIWDVVKTASSVIRCQESGNFIRDDIDHLGNRRTRSSGEQILRAFTNGMREMERQTAKKLDFIIDSEEVKDIEDYLDAAPVKYALRSFFASSELCQFMDQNNPLAELRQKRTVSALGPNGLDRSRAGFDVRDIHHTHYGRLCPVETPEGKNSGLISRLSIYSRRNEYGFLETPYRVVSRKADFTYESVTGRIPLEDFIDSSGTVIFKGGERITEEKASEAYFTNPEITEFAVIPFVTNKIIWLDAEEEDRYTIAQSTSRLNKFGEFIEKQVKCRRYPDFLTCRPSEIDLFDISPQQAAGISAACIPFLEHDDGHRALMGTNMLSQAVPLLYPEIPLVMTGMERYAAMDSAQLLRSEWNGNIVYADGACIDLRTDIGAVYAMRMKKYQRSNYGTCISQKPVVKTGQTVRKGDVLADAACTKEGILALGHNPVIAFMCWDGYNFEDAIVVSEKLIREDKFTSVDIIRFEAKASYTEAGLEEITRDIPRTDPKNLAHLDDRGIAKIGRVLKGGDVIIGKVSPRRENDFDDEIAEDISLKDIFGKKAAKYKDSSVRLPKYMKATVIDLKVFTHENMPDMDTLTEMIVRVTVAKKRKLEPGDKMSGRHGNKGVVAVVVPEEDMPYMEDGTPVDILLNPLGVPGRMNVGQILEVWLGWAAYRLGMRCETPVFDSATVHDIEAELARAWLTDEAEENFRKEAWEGMIGTKPFVRADKWNFSRNTRLYRVLHSPVSFELSEEKLVRKYEEICFEEACPDPIIRREWIADRWIVKNGLSAEGVFDWNGIPENAPAVYPCNSAAIITCLKLWLKKNGWPYELPEGEDELRLAAGSWSSEIKEPLPVTGKQWLRDGRTGERFDHPVNVGVMNMIKLHHLVEDKVQARSTGNYSMITQQPLGGKLNNGGQRIGEMEVWALEAYGCANLLQEMLTIKSDDTEGRKKAGWNMHHGLPVDVPGIPESFHVLVHELMGLGLTLSAFYDSGESSPLGLEESSSDEDPEETGDAGI